MREEAAVEQQRPLQHAQGSGGWISCVRCNMREGAAGSDCGRTDVGRFEPAADGAFDAGEAVGEGSHVGADFAVGDFGVDLSGADVRVAEDAAEGFDGHAAVEGQRGEGMAADVEGQVLADAAAGGQVLQVLVAAVVARHGEEAAVGLRAAVLLD